MKCISIRQPWAWAIVHAGKNIENRTWSTNYRGPLLIHASKSIVEADLPICLDIALRANGGNLPKGAIPDGVGYRNYMASMAPRGAIIGVARIVDVVEDRLDCGNSPWYSGPYGLVLEDQCAFSKPIPWRGKLSLFDVPDDELAARLGGRDRFVAERIYAHTAEER